MVHFTTGTGEFFTVILKATGGTRTVEIVNKPYTASSGSLRLSIQMNSNRKVYFIIEYNADYVRVPTISCSSILLS